MLIGNIIIIGIVTGLFIFISDGITQYGVTAPEGYNESFSKITNTQIDLINNLNATYDDLNNVDSSTTGSTGNTDFLGFFFNAGYTGARTATGSITGVNTMIDVAIGGLPLGSYGAVLKTLFLTAIVVVVIIGILLNFIIKSGRE
jgi:hypothetical protein